jgi:glycerophosphoryl diester phosphodiesterase
MITIVAHRGAPALAHENTIESFNAALSLGADMVELDVRRSGDGKLLVHHDPWLSRRTRRPLLAELTFAGITARAAKKKFRVPLLREALKALSGRTALDIEIKEAGCEKEVIALALDYFDHDKFVLTSFNPAVAEAVKSENGRLSAGLIIVAESGIAACETTRADVFAPEKKLFAARRPFFAAAKKKGKKIAVWTVDSTELLSGLLLDPVVDAIITNRPDRALALRKKLGGV